LITKCETQAPENVKILHQTKKVSCDNANILSNFAIIQGIRRGLIFGCPTWNKTEEKCTKLLKFVNTCLDYPLNEEKAKEKTKKEIKN
jgi:hypothetical protein